MHALLFLHAWCNSLNSVVPSCLTLLAQMIATNYWQNGFAIYLLHTTICPLVSDVHAFFVLYSACWQIRQQALDLSSILLGTHMWLARQCAPSSASRCLHMFGSGLMAEVNCTWCAAGKYQTGSGCFKSLLSSSSFSSTLF